ncbi:cytochrome P450 monooxygenase GliC2 [Talaromyces proteolyticus]|uniref:Cytochrome P450 monooxygenase GliC2 n=1 Tax=Talaromyces proteolyticus TaxID=1131652 RepID=A0AAD4KX94_9EURO|nr:cytochrome P450 monooxygenase GliC2 [Talaromyces proteolyticus]KAH8702189.1 cytochrome P450 monooxygenase GliC2 [Talaromyces proteolyticus]
MDSFNQSSSLPSEMFLKGYIALGGTSAVIGTSALAIFVTALLFTNKSVLGTIMNFFLNLRYQYPRVDGKGYMKGPGYIFPNGQMTEKFLNAAQKSKEWEEENGSVYRVWAGTVPEVVITQSADVERLYQQSNDHNKAHQANAGWLLTQLLGSGLGLINGTRWTNLRKKLDPMFSHRTSMQLLHETFNSTAEDHVINLNQYAVTQPQEKNDEKGFIINATQAVQRYPFFEVAQMFYGKMTKDEKEKLWELGKLYSQVFGSIVFGGIHRTKWTKYINTKAYQSAKEYQKQFRHFNMDMYNSRKVDAPTTPIVTLIDAAKRGELTEKEVTDTIAESSFANLDIVTQVISSCIILLADAPAVQADLLAEIRKNKDDHENYIARKDTLIHYCLLEALRLRPVLAFTFPENPPREKRLGDFIVPKDTTVIVDAFAINIRNPFWGPDNRSYRPRRFESIKPNQLRYNLSTFGYGPRKCLGQYIADKIIKSLVFHLFYKYEVSLNLGQDDKGDFKVDKTSWVGLYDLELKLVAR